MKVFRKAEFKMINYDIRSLPVLKTSNTTKFNKNKQQISELVFFFQVRSLTNTTKSKIVSTGEISDRAKQFPCSDIL